MNKAQEIQLLESKKIPYKHDKTLIQVGTILSARATRKRYIVTKINNFDGRMMSQIVCDGFQTKVCEGVHIWYTI